KQHLDINIKTFMKFRTLLVHILMVSASLTFAQTGIDRIEFDLKGDYENQKVFPLNKNGMLIQSTASQSKKGELEIRNEFYDTGFNLLSTQSVYVKERTEILDSYHEK